MKLVIRTVIFHLICIILFSYLYLNVSEDFQNGKNINKKYNSYIDFLLLSTTIQSGVGISDLYPISYYGKLLVICQQFIMILTHVITLYIFTL